MPPGITEADDITFVIELKALKPGMPPTMRPGGPGGPGGPGTPLPPGLKEKLRKAGKAKLPTATEGAPAKPPTPTP